MLPAFLTPFPISSNKRNSCALRKPRYIRRHITPKARVRRGFQPEPVIPENLYATEPIYDIDAQFFDFNTLKDKVVLVSNAASDDTYTESNYSLFAQLLESYHDSGLEVIVFPSNWYGQKETGSAKEIKEFVHSTYSDKIIVMSKTDIEWNQVFALGCRYYPGEIIWNFHGKFLFNRQGLPVHRFDLLSTNEYIEDQVRVQIAGGYTSPVPPDEGLQYSMDFPSFDG